MSIIVRGVGLALIVVVVPLLRVVVALAEAATILVGTTSDEPSEIPEPKARDEGLKKATLVRLHANGVKREALG